MKVKIDMTDVHHSVPEAKACADASLLQKAQCHQVLVRHPCSLPNAYAHRSVGPHRLGWALGNMLVFVCASHIYHVSQLSFVLIQQILSSKSESESDAQ